MNIDLVPPESWQSSCDHLAHYLQISKKNSLRLFRGAYPAVYELTVGAAQLMSHKRAVGIVKGNSPHLSKLFPHFLREAYTIQAPRLDQIENVKEWVGLLKKDTLFVAMAEDHPITGELFNWEELDRELNDRKIQSVRVSYNSFWRDLGREERPYSIRICSLGRELAIAVIGERYKISPLLAQDMIFPDTPTLEAGVKQLRKSFNEKHTVVNQFEDHLPQGFQRLLTTDQRLYDRALVYHNLLSGDGLINALSKELKFELKSPGNENNIETINLCRWGSTGLFNNWWEPFPNSMVQRGLVVLSLDILERPNLHSVLEKVTKEAYFEI